MKNLIFTAITIVAYLSSLPAFGQSPPDSIVRRLQAERAYYKTLGQEYSPDSTVTVSKTTISDIKGYWFNEHLLDRPRIILYLHGGGYIMGSMDTYRPMLTHLAKHLGAAVLFIEYSLAPEHPFPVANLEVLGVYQDLIMRYPDHKITVAGDSAGGGLAISLVHYASQARLPLPASLTLVSPWIDLKNDNESFVTRQALDPILDRKTLERYAAYYAPNGIEEADPSELTFTEFPPVLLMVGTDEVLIDDAKNFYAYIKPVQRKARLKVYAGQKHVWPVSDIHSQESAAALDDIRDFVAKH